MEDFGTIQANVQSAILSTIRSASVLADEDVSFHRSLDAGFGAALDKQNARLLGLTSRLLGAATANTDVVRAPSPSSSSSRSLLRLSDLESVEENWKAVVDVVDSLLERADTALDEFTGAVRRLSPGLEQAMNLRPTKTSKIAAALRNQDIEKPQLLFEHIPSNTEKIPFKPLLLQKPFATAPLLEKPVANGSDATPSYPHPYQQEIEQYRYPSPMYVSSDPIPYNPFESTTATFVDTEDAVDAMLQELKLAKEIAIDLEHHDTRSYIGIVSLMQISTRDKDWIVDTLKPWRRKLQCLNEVFANPAIVKVLHGAYMDIVWLQRDLGLYIVGLFDTYFAACALGYTGRSLAFLLKKFVNVDAQKQYQTADWRVRPLPQELFDYARSDTHYLLYVFDSMRNELIDQSDFSKPGHEGDKLWYVLENSSETALQRYEHPVYDIELGQGSGGWYKLLARSSVLFTKVQFAVFRAVHKWRDEVARQQDDGLHYVMPNHHIFSIARAMPSTRSELLSVTQPGTQTIRLRADELVQVIITAKASGPDGPDMVELMNRIDPAHPYRAATTPKTVQDSTPSTAKSSVPVEVLQSSTSALPLRSSKSSFWGAAFESSPWDHQARYLSTAPSATNNSITFAVPLPPLTAEVFAAAPTPLKPLSPAPAPPAEKANPSAQDGEDSNDIFILKQLGRKRKHPDAPSSTLGTIDGMAAQSDKLTFPEIDATSAARAEKAERKKAKKAAKRAAAATTDSASSPHPSTIISTYNTDEDDEDTPFDYSSAPSILNPPREILDANAKKERRAKERKANPYSKALDAPKGLPRAQREGPGRSMTFRS